MKAAATDVFDVELAAQAVVGKANGDLDKAVLRATKAAANTRWALKGAGAKANPPKGERKTTLATTLRNQESLVKALRKRRDESKAAKS